MLRIIILLGVVFIAAVFMTGCADKGAGCESHVPLSQPFGDTVDGLSAGLLVTNEVWNLRGPLEVCGLVMNRSAKPLRVDRNWSLGSTVIIRAKAGDRVVEWPQRSGRIAPPQPEQQSELQPGDLYGHKFVIGADTEGMGSWADQLRDAAPGRVLLQLEYRAIDYAFDWRSGKARWWTGVVRSRWVPVLIE